MRAALILVLLVSASGMPAEPHQERVLAPASGDAAAIAQTLALPQATWHNDRDGDKVFDSLEGRFAAGHDMLPVIVTTTHDADVAQVLAAAQAVTAFQPRHVYHHVGGFAADLGLDQVTAIAGLAGVRQVEWSQPGAPELDTARPSMGADAVQVELGLDGDRDGDPGNFTPDDVVVAILDTGFDGKHVDLAGKFLTFVDWSDGGKQKEPYDSGSHGTHVAGIVGGTGAGDARYRGVAPGAAFVGYQITGGDDTKGAAIASIDHMLGNPDLSVDILTISFGFGTTVDGTDALELAMDKAFAAGILPFKSTGNSGPEVGTVTVPGGARGIVATANMGDPGAGGMHLRTSSSRGPTQDGRLKPDLAAPGTSIMAAAVHDPDAAQPIYDGYVEKTGTSMASPFAAGVAALVLDADPSLTNDQVRSLLFATAHDWGLPGKDIDFGHGRIDALRAVQSASLARALREGSDASVLAALNVSAPQVPAYRFDVVTATQATDGVVRRSFDVVDPSQPLAVTFVVNGTDTIPDPDPTTLPTGHTLNPQPPRRAFSIRLVDPAGADLPMLALPTSARQVTFTGIPAMEGTYTLEFAHLMPGGEVYYAVSGGLPEDALQLVPVLPSIAEYEARLEALQEDPSQASPGLPMVILAAILGLVATRRRR